MNSHNSVINGALDIKYAIAGSITENYETHHMAGVDQFDAVS